MRRAWDLWKRIAVKVGDFQARFLLTLFYFIVLGPFALATRWGSDPLGMKPGTPKGWRLTEQEAHAVMEFAKRQS
jgi:hypothetical protein